MSRAHLHAFSTALALLMPSTHCSGRCEGTPGLRLHYHPHSWGAYFRDTEGNQLAVACHQPE